uniref:Uncharacterized protein n=1 Tax=Physcomitrium patens TaxID=3218 RepID=A0A2K1JYD2_PHYPA|nr:hypothetical protein PHYPA_013655 [Physcomitrium patens]
MLLLRVLEICVIRGNSKISFTSNCIAPIVGLQYLQAMETHTEPWHLCLAILRTLQMGSRGRVMHMGSAVEITMVATIPAASQSM